MTKGQFSKWKEARSSVFQGLVLRPLLFNLLIKDKELGISNKVAKFEEDTKLFQKVKSRMEY